MGKIPQALRTASQSPISTLLNTNTLQQQTNSPIPYKPQTKKPLTKPQTKTNNNNYAPSPITFETPNLSSAKTLFSSLISNSKTTPTDPSFYNSILKSFSSISTLQDSIFFLNHMVKTHPPFSPTRFTYHILLVQACSQQEDNCLTNVHNMLNLMAYNGVPPTNVSVDVAVRALCGVGREEHAVELVKELCGRKIALDTYTYNFMVRHLVKNRSLSSVNAFVDDMKVFGIEPDVVTYTIMIDNVCNSKNLREAVRLLGVLQESGHKLDCYVFNTIMKGYSDMSQGGQVLEVYKKMQEEGVKPDKYTYNILIYGLSKSGRVNEAMKFLGVMTEIGHFPDEITYTSLMNGMCREGKTLEAVKLLQEMEVNGCVPNSCTYNTLLHGLCKAKLLDKAVGLYEEMKQGGVKLDSGTYGTFLRTLCRSGKVAEAYEVFDYAIESKSLTDVVAYSTLESTLKWLSKARGQGLKV